LRRKIEPDPKAPRIILTVVGEGYKFAAKVLEAAPAALEPSPSLPDKPSIAVLPFANMSVDPEQEYFINGVVEEIITALSRIRRDRWQFEAYVQQAGRRREAGRAPIGRAVRTCRLGSQNWGSRAYRRSADRRNEGGASLGRPVRRLAGKCIRTAG